MLGKVFKLPPRGCPACTRSARNPRVHAASVETTSQASQTVGAGKQTQVSIFFETPWKQSVLHGSISGAPWKDVPLNRVGSAPNRWSSCTLPVPQASAAAGAPLLEFVLRHGLKDEWNKPAQGGNYVIDAPGSYTIRSNAVQHSTGTPVMLVSDLDGTMVGDDAATAAFRNWWEEEAVTRGSGSVLVYNTGRSLDSFLGLMKEKGHFLAHPDALISAVGTKVHSFDGESWREDAAWTAQLDKDWDLVAVRDAAYKALTQAGRDNMHFRPKEELNQHKVTCGVKVEVLDSVLASLAASFAAAGIKANMITSGHGDWRFLDIVPIRAGKLEALQYVQGQYGFPTQQVVACGDSGNDILMLQGENPAVVVGNSQPDLVKWYTEQMKTEANSTSGPGGRARLYFAPRHEAYSILEGLHYWNLK
uniref:Sucrose phosphatase-like domain-containing protein n=1 Tax=Dunaliella tertiolecta TaxID=3047 RepID=A0A7S3RAP8_DUNTE|mmetsp:Transcript_22112/g.61191  ORF Transcript_22112/g.61191 Transcript_22112/m.61191 type:complete len:419 (-) Transcript_22112:293-1549(-)